MDLSSELFWVHVVFMQTKIQRRFKKDVNWNILRVTSLQVQNDLFHHTIFILEIEGSLNSSCSGLSIYQAYSQR